MEKAREYMLKIFNLLVRPEMRILPGHLAFFLVLTLVPLVALIATLTANLSISTEALNEAIAVSTPDEISAVLNSINAGSGINFNMIIFYITTFFLASNGTFSMINISNEIYRIEPNGLIRRRVKAVLMIIIVLVLFMFLLLVPVFGSTLSNIIGLITEEDTVTNVIREMLGILKYPIMILILFSNIKLMYIIAPDESIPSNTTNKGALFTTFSWIIATEVFTFYIDRFTSYDVFYGSISNIIVLLLWVYLLSYIYTLGMVINASSYKSAIEE